jgi:Rrf2 family protein
MFVSKSLDYAMRSLIYLAQRGERVVSLRELSRSVRVPVPYLAKVMRLLVRGGLVHSDPGAKGGYRLNRAPEAITLKEVYEVMEGGFHTVECLTNPRICDLTPTCTQAQIWQTLEEEVLDILGKKSLKDCLPPSPFIPESRIQESRFSQDPSPSSQGGSL